MNEIFGVHKTEVSGSDVVNEGSEFVSELPGRGTFKSKLLNVVKPGWNDGRLLQFLMSNSAEDLEGPLSAEERAFIEKGYRAAIQPLMHLRLVDSHGQFIGIDDCTYTIPTLREVLQSITSADYDVVANQFSSPVLVVNPFALKLATLIKKTGAIRKNSSGEWRRMAKFDPKRIGLDADVEGKILYGDDRCTKAELLHELSTSKFPGCRISFIEGDLNCSEPEVDEIRGLTLEDYLMLHATLFEGCNYFTEDTERIREPFSDRRISCTMLKGIHSSGVDDGRVPVAGFRRKDVSTGMTSGYSQYIMFADTDSRSYPVNSIFARHAYDVSVLVH